MSKTVVTSRGVVLTLKETIAFGGDNAMVSSVHESPDVLVKYHFDVDQALAARLTAMVGHKVVHEIAYGLPGFIRLAWPMDVVRDAPDSTIVGFVMPHITGRSLADLAEEDAATDEFAGFNWSRLINVRWHVSDTVARLHAVRLVLSDISPRNVIVTPSGMATIIDCDSMSFSMEGQYFGSDFLTSEYSAPERLTHPTTEPSELSDRFSLALLLVQALTYNVSPFRTTPDQQRRRLTIEDNLENGNCTLFSSDEPGIVWARSLLPPGLLTLARRALVEGGRRGANIYDPPPASGRRRSPTLIDRFARALRTHGTASARRLRTVRSAWA